MSENRVKFIPFHPGDHDSCFTCNLQFVDRDGILGCSSEMNQADRFPDDCPFHMTEDEARDE